MRERVEVDPEEQVVRTERKVGKSGNSIVIRIPPQLLEAAGFQVDDRVVLEADMKDGGLSIRKPEPSEGEEDS